jgi:alpha-tubulin suppressor-like RCC1 family protein
MVDIQTGRAGSMALSAEGKVITWGTTSGLNASSKPSGLDVGVKQIAASYYAAACVREDGSVAVWGSLPTGVVNVPSEAQSGVEKVCINRNSCFALKDGGVIGWGSTATSEDVPVAAESGVIDIVTAWYNVFALKSDGTLVGWGSNNNTLNLMPATAGENAKQVYAGGYAVIVLNNDGTTLSWGTTTNNVLPLNVVTGKNQLSYSIGYQIGMSIRADGGYYLWGATTTYQQSSGFIPAVAQTNAMKYSAEYRHTLALVRD